VYFDAGSRPMSPKSPGSFPSRADSENEGFHDLVASALEPLPDDCSIPACLSPARARREATTLNNAGSGVLPAATLIAAFSTGSHDGAEPVQRRRRAAEPLDGMGAGTIPADLHSPQDADIDADTAVAARPSVLIQDEMESAAVVEGEPEGPLSGANLVIICEGDAE